MPTVSASRLPQSARAAMIPGRVFLDTSIVQTLYTYGSFIYDGEDLAPDARVCAVPNGVGNLEALRDIVHVWGGHGQFQLALSSAGMQEVADRGRVGFLHWANELMAYTNDWLRSLETRESIPSPSAMRLADKLDAPPLKHNVSTKDRRLLKDAVLFGCDVFLTMERRLPKMGDRVQQQVGVAVLQPVAYWQRLAPYAALF